MKRTLEFNVLGYIVVLPLCNFSQEEYRYYYDGEQLEELSYGGLDKFTSWYSKEAIKRLYGR